MIKYYLIFTGERLEGEIIGFSEGARSTMNMVGYNYVIRVEYQDEFYICRAIQSKGGSSHWRPEVPQDKHCTVYFNPKYPKVVSMTGTYGIEIASGFLLLLGGLAIFGTIVI